MIKQVKLKNWKSHEDSELNFSSGTNVLIGIMGSGKSSIMDAICFAFFGTFPLLQSKKLKLDDILMKRPVEKDKSEVELTFENNGSLYSVRRVIEKGKGTSYSELKENGKIIESPNSQRVIECVEKILKVNYDLFSKAIYSEQNALDYFLTIPRGQRMRKIDELLMIDKFEKARANATSLANRLGNRKVDKESEIEFADTESLEKNVADLKNDLKKLLEERGRIAIRLEQITKDKGMMEVEVEGLKKIKDNLELLRREHTGVESSIDEINKFIKNLGSAIGGKNKEELQKNLATAKQKIAELDKKLAESRESYEKIFSLISNSKAKLEYLENDRIGKMEREIEEKLRMQKELDGMKAMIGGDIEKKVNEKRVLYESLIEKYQEIKAKIKNIDDTMQQLSSLGGVCPICDSKLSEEKKRFLMKQKQLQVNALKSMLQEILEKRIGCEKELRKIEEDSKRLEMMGVDIGDLEKISEELEEAKRIYSKMSESAKAYAVELEKIKNYLEEIENEKNGVSTAKQEYEILVKQFEEYHERRGRLEELAKRKEKLEGKIKIVKMKVVEKNIEDMERVFRNLVAEERELETKIISSVQLAKEKEVRIKEYEMKLNNALRQRGEIKRLEILVKELKIFAKALEQTQIELRKEFVEAVNYSMSKLWTTLYPYEDFMSIRLSVDEGDYVLQLCERSGRWVNVEGVASGGERSIACLALRIAFSLVLAPQMRTLILDEPTANLDSSAIDMLAKTLRERIYEFVDQCFIITHQPELEEAVTGRAYRLERDKKKDEATKVIVLS